MEGFLAPGRRAISCIYAGLVLFCMVERGDICGYGFTTYGGVLIMLVCVQTKYLRIIRSKIPVL